MEILNADDYRIILKNYSKTDDIKFVSSKYVSLGNEIAGFMGDYFILEIVFKVGDSKSEEKFFVKTLPTHTEVQREMAGRRNCYGKEIFYYNFLVKEYEKLGFDTSFVPECYFCKDTKALIMENLVSNNFSLSEKNKLYDFDQIKCGLKSLALYHSASILYEENMSKKLNRKFRLQDEYPDLFKETFLDAKYDDVFCSKLYYGTLDCINYVAKDIRKDSFRSDFNDYLTIDNILSGIYTETKLRKATGHGDLWYNNIFFKYDNNKANECKLVDHQILRYSVPAFDVLLFIYLNSSKEFRSKNMKDLLNFYYNTISENISRHGFDTSKIFPIEEFKESLKFIETTALFAVLSCAKLVNLPANMMQEMYDDLNEDWAEIFLALFSKALENEVYRKHIVDIIDDFYESLIGNNNNKDYF